MAGETTITVIGNLAVLADRPVIQSQSHCQRAHEAQKRMLMW
jgi:hypothetical protein